MGDKTIPTEDEIDALREHWMLADPAHALEQMQKLGDRAMITPFPDAVYRRYLDAVARRDAAHRAEEVAATIELARTNTTLAQRQMWLAFAITAATLVQTATAVIALCQGGR